LRPAFYSEYFRIEDRHWWFLGRRRILIRLLDRALPRSSEGRRILDIGCGTGTMVQQLERYGSVLGIDADHDAVRFCRERGVDNVQQASGDDLPFDEGSFDLVTALDVLEHMEDDAAGLSEIHRVLRPGGTLVLTVPAYRFLWGAQDEISHHYRRYTRGELTGRLADAGFSVQRASYFNALLFPVIAAVRLARRLRPAPAELRSDFEMTPPGRLNRALGWLFGREAELVGRVNLPFGVSIVTVASRNGASS
jgi:SAM-dependent methyltransferase